MTADLIAWPTARKRDDEAVEKAARAFYETMANRRTLRDFSNRPVAQTVIADLIRTGGTAPSGANLQPWHFVAVSEPGLKREIRIAAEEEEREFYQQRAPAEWLEALAPLGTDWRKPFLEIAPWLIAIFAVPYRVLADGRKLKHYYATESVGIATGLLLAAVHHAGLVALTHTPSPMSFLNRILHRPPHEKPFLLLVVGHPPADPHVPNISRKPLNEIATFV